MRGELPGQTISTGGKLDLGFDDEALLFDKEYRCPVCKKPFTMKRVRSDEAVSDGRDIDLRPRYKNIDVLKYRVIECPACGYAELDKFFSNINSNE
ncbi:MAG: DUF2225 domain-containing protein, partial [Lachnospiraceae bacterium]|nr:DUF2225 domain-containing protein [Lachnospiraceae bacterium]